MDVQQFSASLSQYKMKRFGGFKVAKVLRELQRGKHLVSGEWSIIPLPLIMAALRSRCGRYFCPVVSSFFFSFLAYSQPSQIGCLLHLHTWCGISTNLGCRSVTCCKWLTENTGCKNSPNFAVLNRGRHLYLAGGNHIGHWSTF